MAKFKYTGPDNTLVGRFGRLQQGQVVELWHSEAEYVRARNDGSWEAVEDPNDSNEGVGVVLPSRTRFFDLTKVRWSDMKKALGRLNRTTLLAACKGMADIGARMPSAKVLNSYSHRALSETVFAEAVRLKWNQPGYGPVDRNEKPETDLPIITPPDTEEPAELAEPAPEPEVAPEPAPKAKTKAKPAPEPEPIKSYRAIRREKK